ncbi:MAG: hypothetical protein HQ541_02665 [Mariniphaga sp.]|nr:hypothetical protein [Mariniphaga sp.]
MKARIFSTFLIIILFFSGCVVFSFYPLYTEKDLFENDLLTGTWVDDDQTEWMFEHPLKNKNKPESADKTSYKLTLQYKEFENSGDSSFDVKVVKLDNNYFLNFYLNEYYDGEFFDFAQFSVIPVHTFAKVEFEDDVVKIKWFAQDWLRNLSEQNKIRIHYEKNDDYILLTAKPKELQKFVTKYVNSDERFFEGGIADTEIVLERK